MSRRLQFGSGPNLLPPPWENFDAETDIRKPLPFPIGSAGFILAEHVIEHVDFRSGVRFLQECWRILEPGGVLRLAFPDITREIAIEDYRADFLKHYNRQINCREDAWFSVITDWEHQSCWTCEMAIRVLLSIGFEDVIEWGFRWGRLAGVDWQDRPESTILEAVR